MRPNFSNPEGLKKTEAKNLRLPVTEIVKVFPAEYLKKVLLRVKNYYMQAPVDFKNRYRDVIEHYLILNREERRALEKMIRKALSNNWPNQNAPEKIKLFPDVLMYQLLKDDKVANAVLEIWIESQQELCSAIADFLKGKSFTVDNGWTLSQGFLGTQQPEAAE